MGAWWISSVVSLVAVGAGHLVGDYLMSRSSEELIELDEETIQYLERK